MHGVSPQAAFEAALAALPAGLVEAPIGVAVSGGSDSLALLVLAHRWAAGQGRRLQALTVDHGLRPEARVEAETVARICQDRGIPHDILSLQGVAPRQAALRRARHAALAQALRDKCGHLLLTGHTADDQAETFLLRTRQGSGWYGLAGMRPLALSPVWPEGEGVFIARPLLKAGRASLRGLLQAEGLGWAEDPSNENPAYERVRMRQILCHDLSRSVTVLSLAEQFETLRMLEDALIWRWLHANVRLGEGGIIVTSLADLPPERAVRALALLLQIASGREMPARREAVARLVDSIVLKEKFRGATLGGCRIMPKRGALLLRPEAGLLAPTARARLHSAAAILSGHWDEIVPTAGKESFLEDLVPIF